MTDGCNVRGHQFESVSCLSEQGGTKSLSYLQRQFLNRGSVYFGHRAPAVSHLQAAGSCRSLGWREPKQEQKEMEVLGGSGKRVYQRGAKTSSLCKFNESMGTHLNDKDLAEQEASGPAWGGPHSKRTPVPRSPGRTFLISPNLPPSC